MNEALKAIVLIILATVVLIVLSIIYFIITLFVVKVASDLVFGSGLSMDWAVMAAAIITLGSMLGASMGKGATHIFMKSD